MGGSSTCFTVLSRCYVLIAQDTRKDYGEPTFVKGKNMPRQPNPQKTAADSPELTKEWFATAKPARGVLPKLFAKKTATQLLTPRRGRPPSLSPKEHINIRIDTDVLTAFKKGGNGWQTRVNDALREWLKRSIPLEK
jgi:uncharacterized protein (DUF4415 family)